MIKKSSFNIIVASALCAGMLSGCGMFSQKGVAGSEGKVVTLADGRTVVVSNDREAITSASSSSSSVTTKKKEKSLAKPKNSGKKNKKDKNSKKKRIKGSERSAIVETAAAGNSAASSATGTSSASTSSLSTVNGISAVSSTLPADFTPEGEWTIYSVRGNLVKGEERPYITLDLAAKRFYGNNGCNYINGDLTLSSPDKVSFTNVISTMKMCQDDEYQYLINLALNDVVSYSVRYEKPLTFLDLKDKTGATVMVLRRHNMDFLNGGWKVTELNGTPLVQDDDATMTFNTSDLKIHGTTGCNIFNGNLFIDPDKLNSLQIIGLATTRMACAPDSRETEFLLALESVETARLISPDTIGLFDVDGKQLFTMTKMDLRQNEE